MKKIATCVVFGAIMLLCAYSAHSDAVASFATGGYATALRTPAMMHKMDTNHDNMVSRSEWLAFQNKVFSMMDKNHTGRVDLAEFVGAYPVLADFASGGYASSLCNQDMFRKIDMNGDGTITRQEFISYQLKIFDMMDTSTVHKGMLGPAEFFGSGGAPPS
jgi:hypothetical protein